MPSLAKAASPAELLEAQLAHRVLVLDGAMGTMIQQADLGPDDFGGPDLEGCNEHLVLTRPDVILGIHQAYLEAGADVIETNTFGATALVLDEYDIGHLAARINLEAARLAREAADAAATPERPRFVAGAMGPTTKSLSVTGGTTFDALVANYAEQAQALLEGGVDLLMVETIQDGRNAKAAGIGIDQAFTATGRRVPVLLSATIEPTGTMLAGQSIEAFHTSMEHLTPLAVGMNCATGPEFMTDHVRALADLAPGYVSVYPNAGLPDEDGIYPETPASLAKKLERFVDEGWVNLVGACCGSTPEHIRAIARMVEGKAPRRPSGTPRAAVAGIDHAPIVQEERPVLVGERTNVIGSLRFKRLVERDDWEAAAEIGRAQVKRGAQVVDVCLSHTDRDEVADIEAFYPRLLRRVRAPVMIDATDPVAIEAALKQVQGKAIINSINLEDGEQRFDEVVPLAKRYGAALVVGCIDEQGMAVTAARKLEVAKRSHALLTGKHGIPERDLVFDPLVFPCGTGDEAYVGSAGQTVEGVRRIQEALPGCSTILGISNVSFGLPEAGREVLNSVFLHDCVAAGLTFAIVNTQGIERYPEIDEKARGLCRALLYDEGDDPLGAFVEHFRGRKKRREEVGRPKGTTEERLAKYIVEGTKEWLIADLDELLARGTAPLDIINGPLMTGMAEVGRLFGANELIVAEVLQSAEVMKAAVRHLEPLMEAGTTSTKGKVVLATVKGDVHDIGKNLVEIVLGNNGYDIIDLGIKVPPERLIEACREHRPDIIGLSGLLVKSAQQMVTTASDLQAAGIKAPIVVGGAALSRKFTASRIAPGYDGIVAYAKDAMDGLSLLDRIIADAEGFDVSNRAGQAEVASRPGRAVSTEPAVHEPLPFAAPLAVPDHERHIVNAPAKEVFGWINPKMLYGKHMGLRGDPLKLIRQGDAKALELHGLWKELLAIAPRRGLLAPRGVWRFLPAQAEGDDVLVYAPGTTSEGGDVLERFSFERQAATPRRCLSDLLPQVDSGAIDHVGLFVVTAGEGVRAQAQAWKEEGEYLRSHAVQALALETAEGFAEKLHADMRQAWGIDEETMSKKDVFQARYRGCRYSFGYPACPDLADQEKLFRLLAPDEIGVQLTDGHMMDPEASVSALVFHHPEATYFQV